MVSKLEKLQEELQNMRKEITNFQLDKEASDETKDLFKKIENWSQKIAGDLENATKKI